MSDFKTAFTKEIERRAKVEVEMASHETETLDGCPDSFAGKFKVNRHCRLQPVRYQKHGGEFTTSYQLCPPRCYLDNWPRCPVRELMKVQQGAVALSPQ